MKDNELIINVGRQFGSGGRLVALALGRKLGIPVYDQELIAKAAEQSGFSKELFANSDEKRNLLALSSFIVDVGRFGSADNYMSDNQLFVIQSNVIRQACDLGDLHPGGGLYLIPGDRRAPVDAGDPHLHAEAVERVHQNIRILPQLQRRIGIRRLADAGLNMQWKGEPKGDRLAGKTLVVTGTLETLSRNEAEALIVKNGGKASV